MATEATTMTTTMSVVYLPVEALGAIAAFLPYKGIRPLLEVNCKFTAVLLNLAAKQHGKISRQLSVLKQRWKRIAFDALTHLAQVVGPEDSSSPIVVVQMKREENRLSREVMTEAEGSVLKAVKENKERMLVVRLKRSLSVLALNNAAAGPNTGSRQVYMLASDYGQARRSIRFIGIGVRSDDEDVWTVFQVAEAEKELAKLCRHLH